MSECFRNRAGRVVMPYEGVDTATNATCPVCGTQCRIAGDPSSVTRWYEPAEQSELETRIKELEAVNAELADLGKDAYRKWKLAEKRITELEAEKAAHVCRATIVQTIRTPDLVIEESE